jgi:hypothetical protein
MEQVLLAVDVVVMVLVEGGDRVGVADPKVDGLGQAAESLAGPGHVRVLPVEAVVLLLRELAEW